VRQRVFTKNPVRENCTPGSVRGLSGNWQSYRDLRDCSFYFVTLCPKPNAYAWTLGSALNGWAV
jgi:hypothetical protein